MANDTINNMTARNLAVMSNQQVQSGVSQINQQDTTEKGGNFVPPAAKNTADNTSSNTEDLQTVVENLNSQVQFVERNLQFSIDDNSGQTVVKVVNTQTDELIRQIPSEDLLRISERLREQQESSPGLIFEISA